MILKYFIIISILFINNFAYSEEQFTKEEVKEFVLKAYNYMKENGKDKAFDEFNKWGMISGGEIDINKTQILKINGTLSNENSINELNKRLQFSSIAFSSIIFDILAIIKIIGFISFKLKKYKSIFLLCSIIYYKEIIFFFSMLLF